MDKTLTDKIVAWLNAPAHTEDADIMEGALMLLQLNSSPRLLNIQFISDIITQAFKFLLCEWRASLCGIDHVLVHFQDCSDVAFHKGFTSRIPHRIDIISHLSLFNIQKDANLCRCQHFAGKSFYLVQFFVRILH